jgi:L-arabinonolactonase
MHNTTQLNLMSTALIQEAILGESLLWNETGQQWWWTDIESSALFAWKPSTDVVNRYPLHDRVGSFAHCVSGKILLGMAKWLCIADGAENKPLSVTQLAAVDPLESRTRINDGRTDRSGCFVFGTTNEAVEKRPIGSFFQYSRQFGLRRLALPAVAIANSICFSLDGRTMYFADTITRRILQCDYDSETAQVANIHLFSDLAADEEGAVKAYPDGSVIDREGCLWNAQWGAARVVQYAPDGKVIRSIAVPVKNPTCPAFGGVNFDQLMVASSRQEMDASELVAMPAAGSLFGIALDKPTGLPEVLFKD